MGQASKKRNKPSGKVSIKELVHWALSTYGWTFEYLKNMLMEDFNYIMEGCNIFTEKQNKEMKRASQTRGGRTSIDSLDGLIQTPGVKTIKKKK